MVLIGSGVLPGEVCVDLFVINTCCGAEVNFSEVKLEAFPRCLFLRFSSLCRSVPPRLDTSILCCASVVAIQCADDVPAVSAWRRIAR